MKDHHNKQTQFELFPEGPEPSIVKPRPRFFMTELTLLPENFVILGIVLILSMVVSFSLGVERGKKVVLVKKAQQGQRAKTSASPGQVPAENKSNPSIGRLPDSRQEASFSPGGESSLSEDRERAIPVRKRGISLPSSLREEESVLSRALGQRETNLEKNDEKLYTIQVASFKKEETAQKEAMDLKKKGYEILVLPKGNYSIVCVGKFAQRKEAKSFSRKLREQYKDCLIRSL